MKARYDLIGYFILAILGLGTAYFAVPGDRRIAVHVFVLVVGGIVMVAALSAVAAAVPHGRTSDLARALDARPSPEPGVDDLARMERTVTLGVGNAYDLHTRLLPLLRDIASMKLERAGRRPGPETLGRWWELLDPERPAPDDRFSRGIPEPELRALVADLERM